LFSYFIVLCVILSIFDDRELRRSLPKIITLQLIAAFFIRQVLKDSGLFLSSNMPLITIVRDLPIFFAVIYIYKNRVNPIWSIVALLYGAEFIYNFGTFVDLWLIDVSEFSSATAAYKTSSLYSMYSFFGKTIITLMILSLLLNEWIGGARNSLVNRLYFIHSRSNNDCSDYGRLRRRINSFCEKRIS